MASSATQRTDWWLIVGLLTLSSVVVLQDTKYQMLPRNQNVVLWGAEAAVIAGILVLRSGLMRDNHWREEQRRLGTLANNFYEPRRDILVYGFAVGGGVFAGLWWGIATWALLFSGMRRGVQGRGLFDLEIATLCGAISGAIVGAVLGLVVGHLWEEWHRRARRARHPTASF